MILKFEHFKRQPVRTVYAPDFLERDGVMTICAKASTGYYAGTLEYTLQLSGITPLNNCHSNATSLPEDNPTNASENTGHSLILHIPYKKTGNQTKASALVRFFDSKQQKIQIDYLFDNSTSLDIHTDIPTGCTSITIVLLFICHGNGSAEFREPTLDISNPKPQRNIHIATAYIEPKGTAEDNLTQVLALIEEAGRASDKPDIICFTECVYDLRCPDRIYIPQNDPVIKTVCEKAKENAIYVLFTAHERDEQDYYYNTAYLISDKGKICGKYRKTHLTMSEYLAGMVTGNELPVFDTPWGKLGVLICWDQWFYEASRVLASKGAEIVFWLTRGFHEERLITRARDNGMYYVTSHPQPYKCCIAHPTTGEILVRGNGTTRGYASAKINLNERPVSEYKSFGPNGGNDREIFLAERREDLYHYDL